MGLVAVAIALAANAGCSHGGEPINASSATASRPASHPRPPGHPCGVDGKLVPKCGVLVGVATQDHSAAGLAAADRSAHRPYDFVYRFHRIDETLPTPDEEAVVASGRLLHISLDTRGTMSWAEVADGKADEALAAQARALSTLGARVWVTFEHEMDAPAKVGWGSGADFVRAWKHVRSVYTAHGADNAVWVWVSIGTKESLGRTAEMWPGNDEVDWISWDVYNAAGCRTGQLDGSRWVSFEQSFNVFQDWLDANAKRLDIDVRKPVMISELGSSDDPADPSRRPSWYAGITAVLDAHPQVRAIGFWDRTGNGTCDYRYSESTDVAEAVSQVIAATALDLPGWR